MRCANPFVQLDFGGYAKGVALDVAMSRLEAAGVLGAVLNLGGNLAATGHAPGRPWQVGIADPIEGGVLAALHTSGREAVVTSGTTERFRFVDGRRVLHVINPAAGEPADPFASVTVVHRSAALADAVATALLVAGPARWRQVAAGMGVDEVLLVGHRRQITATPRLAARLVFTRGGNSKRSTANAGSRSVIACA